MQRTTAVNSDGGFYKDFDPVSRKPGTNREAFDLNLLQEEIVQTIEAASLSLTTLSRQDFDPSTYTAQLPSAISVLGGPGPGSGSVSSTFKYDTGWVANSDWAKEEFTITHNLDAPLHELIVQFLISPDGTDAAAYTVEDTNRTSGTGSVDHGGYAYYAINNNSFKVQTGEQGIIALKDDGKLTLIENESDYYRVIVYKPQILSTVNTGSIRTVTDDDYTIPGRFDPPAINLTTGATDRTITLPSGSIMQPGDRFTIRKVDSGTGIATITRAGSDTIDGITSVDIDSQYDYATVEWTGSYWSLEAYKSHGGDNSTGYYRREADGTMEQWGIGTKPSGNTNSYSNQYGTSSGTTYTYNGITITFPKPFVSGVDITAITNVNASSIAHQTTVQSKSTTSMNVIYEQGESSTQGTQDFSWHVTGRWRA